MFPLFQVVLAVAVALSSWELAADAPVPPPTRLLFGFAVLLPWIVGGRLLRRLEAARIQLPESSARFERILRTAGRRLRATVLLAYGLVLFAGGWAAWVRDGFDGWILVDEILLLAPFLVATVLGWIQEARLLILANVRERGVRAIVTQQMRLLIVPLAPLALLALGHDIVAASGYAMHLMAFDYLGWAGLALFVFALFGVAPFLLRMALDTQPLPPGPFRDDLETLAASMAFRCREILVWRTPGWAVNAAIVGVIPSARFVLLTDGLLTRLTREEILAVFAHEAAHGRRGHPALLGLFALVFLLLFYAFGSLIPADPITGTAVALAMLVGYWFIGFGFLSRRIEREADLHGAAAIGNPDWMIAALARIATLVGRTHWLTSWLSTWRHFSIPCRIETLRRFAADPSRLVAARRATRLFFLATVLAVVGSSWAAVSRFPRDHAEGRVRLAMLEDDLDRFEHAVEQGLAQYPADAWFWYMRGIGHVERGRLDAADRSFRTALEAGGTGALEAAIREERQKLEQRSETDTH